MYVASWLPFPTDIVQDPDQGMGPPIVVGFSSHLNEPKVRRLPHIPISQVNLDSVGLIVTSSQNYK